MPKPSFPDDGLNTQNFALLAASYQFDGQAKSAEIMNAAPTAILSLVCRLQANFKGHMMRTRYLGLNALLCIINLDAKIQYRFFAIKNTVFALNLI